MCSTFVHSSTHQYIVHHHRQRLTNCNNKLKQGIKQSLPPGRSSTVGSLMHLELMPSNMGPSPKRQVTSTTLERLLAQVTDPDMLLEVESLTPRSVTDLALKVAKSHMNSSGMVSQMALASEPAATARFITSERALLIVDDADMTGEVILLGEAGCAAGDAAGKRTMMSVLDMVEQGFVLFETQAAMLTSQGVTAGRRGARLRSGRSGKLARWGADGLGGLAGTLTGVGVRLRLGLRLRRDRLVGRWGVWLGVVVVDEVAESGEMSGGSVVPGGGLLDVQRGHIMVVTVGGEVERGSGGGRVQDGYGGDKWYRSGGLWDEDGGMCVAETLRGGVTWRDGGRRRMLLWSLDGRELERGEREGSGL